MLMSALAQLRVAASVGLGVRFAPWSLDRLLDAARATRREFGEIGADGAELLAGPGLDEETRRELQLRRFRKGAARAARDTAYYSTLFEGLGLDPARLRHEDLHRIPPTSKDALRDAPDAFVRRSAAPCFRTTTTGTTGAPTGISFSAYEMRTYIALSALSFLASGLVDGSDVVLIGTSARATLGNTCFAGACARIGALVTLGGLIEPAHTLALLAERRRLAGKKERVSVMSTYPSYLGQLVEEGSRLGYRPEDFGLEHIVIGGEPLTEGLRARSRRLFGPVPFEESYAMTETWPVSGQRCRQGHLHFEPGQGLVEVLNPETGQPARGGEAGTIVVTPFPPYRETTILLRYDTQDVVRPVAGPLTCELRTLQATSDVLGKLRLSVRHEEGWTYPREVLEALEADEDVPLPARYGFWAVPGGVAVEAVTRTAGTAMRYRLQRRLEERGVPLRELHLREHPGRLRRPLPLRCDLRELSFAPPRLTGSAPDTAVLQAGD